MGKINVCSPQTLLTELENVRRAQRRYASFPQERVDEIFHAAAVAANRARLPLARMAIDETRMGIFEDKVIKNHFASEYIYNAYKNTPTCGVIGRDDSAGIRTIAEPIGVIAAVVPTTNPTSTAIFKALIALKTRNAVVFSPHPRAAKCTISAAEIMLEAAVNAGAPKGIISWIDKPGIELSNMLMKEADLILATGGPGMVRAAYSSGKPAIGVGAGNTPVIFDVTADIRLAVSSVIHSKTFDNGMICASEQALLVPAEIYDEVKREFGLRGCHFLGEEDMKLLRDSMFVNGSLNAHTVGKSAAEVAATAGVRVPESTRLLIVEPESAEESEVFTHEKLSPVIAMYCTESFENSLNMAHRMISDGGRGHTSSIYINTSVAPERLEMFCNKMQTARILVNSPSSQGGIGDLYNFSLTPSLTLGCGSWGGNSVSENVGIKHLLNIKTIAERRDNMLWFRVPPRVFLRRGCLPHALGELRNKKRVFIVTDEFLFRSGMLAPITDKLCEMGISHTVFSSVQPDPLLSSARRGASEMLRYEPDCIIAFGGGSAMDAGKIMWLLYEHPDADFADMAMRFSDIRKRIYAFPKLGTKAEFVAVPTTAGTGSEVTPFAVITDDESGLKYPLADYELMPSMAIIDCDVMMNAPRNLTAVSGYDAMSHAVEAYASMLATDYTDALALNAIGSIFRYLPRACKHGADDAEAREKMADAATIAGMSFANAFLGICHSMAHKLGSFHHLPHGTANALLLTRVMRWNAVAAPAKMGTFPRYGYPHTLERYGEIADYLGLGGDTAEEKLDRLCARLDELRAEVGIPASIAECGISDEEFFSSLDKMSLQAFDDQCTGANPRYPLVEEIKSIYTYCYYGKKEGEHE